MKITNNPVVAKAIFDKKMAEARAMETQLHARQFTFEDDLVRIVFNGLPSLVELEVKENCSTEHMFICINEVLVKVQQFRDKAAKDLIQK
jgi:DNA-binding protein YbaB